MNAMKTSVLIPTTGDIATVREHAELADRLGYDYAWEVEHHFLEEYSHCPAPEIFLATVAAKTERIRVGHGINVCVPEINHPIRIAERSPDSLAAAATRTLPRTHSDMPVNPVSPENRAPTRKNNDRPQRTPPPSAGSTSSTKKMITTNTPRVRNWRRR